MEQKNKILSMSCPMPTLDFDIITLGHGSGGLLTNKLLEAGVFSIFDNEFLGQKHDGTILSVSSRIAVSTDSFVVSPIFFPGGNIGDLSINGTVNDINMCGARADYLTLSFILEEGLAMTSFWEILLTIKQAADHAGVKIITGDTKVVERGKGDQIFINTTGIGSVMDEANISIGRVASGDKIILSDKIANHGIAIMSVRDGLEFETSVVSDTRHFNNVIPSLIKRHGHAIHLLKDPTRGGIASVLNEVARDTKLGIDIKQSSIPIDDEVEGACEMLGLDPLYVANEGVFIAIVDNDDAEKILSAMQELGFNNAVIIGEVKDEHAGQVIMESKIGGRRVVNMILGEQLPRIC